MSLCNKLMCCLLRGVVRWFGLFFFKQKTAYEMRISDWSSDVCSSDLSSRLVHCRKPASAAPGRLAVDDLADHLAEQGPGEARLVVGDHDEGADAADHVLAIVRVQRLAGRTGQNAAVRHHQRVDGDALGDRLDRKSTRLNSSH